MPVDPPTEEEIERTHARLTPDQLGLVETAGPALAEYRDAVFDAAAAYAIIHVLSGPERETVRIPLESVAGAGRRLEEIGLGEPIEGVVPEGMVLLEGAIEDSLILALSADPERRALCIDHEELALRAEREGRELIGDGYEHYRDQFWQDVHFDVDALNARGREEMGDRWVDRSHGEIIRWLKGEYAEPERQARVSFGSGPIGKRVRGARLDRLSQEIGPEMSEAVGFYKDLDPDGRALGRTDRDGAVAHLHALASNLRRVDIERPRIEGEHYRRKFWPFMNASRSVLRSLVLALSDDPDLRARAMSVDEMQSRIQRAGRQAGLVPEEDEE